MANEIIKGMGFHHIGLKAKDFEKSCAFYKALGLKEVVGWSDPMKTIKMFDLGDGGKIELFSDGGDDYSENGKWVHFAVEVEDPKEAYKIALKAGATSMIAPKIVPLDSEPYKMSIYIAFVKGPDGEQIEFFKQVK